MPTMAEVREKYPQYNDMSDGDLAGALHKKYYADMPKAEFEAKIGYKAPDPAGVKEAPDRGFLGGVNNIVGGVADAITQGVTFGFADEIGAGGRAAHRAITNSIKGAARDLAPDLTTSLLGPETPVERETIGQSYDRALGDIRGRETQFAEEHPVAATVGNVVGGLATGGPAARAVTAAPSIPRAIATSAGMGAGYGAVGGFGAGEGSFENRLASAGQGAALGSLLGGALPAAGAVGNQVVGVGRNLLGLNNPRNTALDQLGRALRRDEARPGAVPAETALTDATVGKPLALVDAAGKNTQRLGRTVETVPGAGSDRAHEFLQDRQLGQVDRVGGDIATHLSGDDFHKTLGELDTLRKTNAAPLYEEAYAQPLAWNATIETLIDRPSTRQALKRAHGIAAEEGRDPTGLGLDLDIDGNVKINKTAASMQTLDYVKRGLDDVVEEYRDGVTGKLRLDESGRAKNNTLRDFVNAVDGVNPKYAEARKAWGGPTKTMEAARLGRQYANGDAEVTLTRFQGLSEGDKTAFRLGVARELAGKVENSRDGHNAVNKIFGSKGQRSRLQALFPDQPSFAAFEKAMQEEQRMALTRQIVTGGSPTGRIAAEQDDAGQLARSALDYAGGGVKGVLFGLASRATGAANRARGINEATADELSKMLFSANRAEQAQALAEVRKRQQQIAQRARAGTGLVSAGTAGTSNLLGQGLATGR
jgi:hypothetical protein